MPRFDGMNAFIRADIENLSASLLLPPNSWRWKVMVYKLEETFYCSRGVGQRERSNRFYTKSYKKNLLARRRAGSPASPSPGLTSNSLTMQMTRKSPNPLWTTTELLRCFSAIAHFSALTSILFLDENVWFCSMCAFLLNSLFQDKWTWKSWQLPPNPDAHRYHCQWSIWLAPWSRPSCSQICEKSKNCP